MLFGTAAEQFSTAVGQLHAVAMQFVERAMVYQAPGAQSSARAM